MQPSAISPISCGSAPVPSVTSQRKSAAAACGGDREDEDPVGDRGDEQPAPAPASDSGRSRARRSQRHGLALVVGLRRVGGLLDGLLTVLARSVVVNKVGQDLVEEAERARQDRLPPSRTSPGPRGGSIDFLTTDSLQS